MASTGELDVRDMHVEADGSFEVIVSKDKCEGNWLPLAEDSSMLLVRQTFLDRTSEEPAKVKIETLDGPAKPPLAETQNIAAALTRAAVTGNCRLLLIGLRYSGAIISIRSTRLIRQCSLEPVAMR